MILLSLLTHLTGVRTLWWFKSNQMSAPQWLIMSQILIFLSVQKLTQCVYVNHFGFK